MAEAEKTDSSQNSETPSFERDRELSQTKYPFLQPVNDNPENTHTGRGRPPLESYLEPEETEEFAFSTERIEENYPFFGTLMKRENGLFKRKEVINRSDPKDMEYVKARYGAGAYQLRLKDQNRNETKINFNVSGVEKADEKKENDNDQVINEKFITDLRRQIKEEIREDYDDLISRLEKRVTTKNEELDEMSRKVRNLSMELAETERSAAKTVRQDIKEFEQKIDELKEEKRDLEFENFELQQELKNAGLEGGFDLKGMLKDAMNDPDVMKFLAPVLAKLFGGEVPPNQSTAALNGARRPNPQQPEDNHHQDDLSGQDNDQPQQEPEPTKQEQMQHLIQQFSTNIVQTVASSMVQNQPVPEQLKDIVLHQIKQLQANGIEVQPQMWINISKKLIEFAMQNSVSAEKAATTIKPILEQIDGAASQLKYIPAAGATEYLVNRFNIHPTDQQREFITEILKVFKKQIKKSD